MLVQPKPEFRNLTKSAVLAALDDPDQQNAIAADVARLVAVYRGNLRSTSRAAACLPAFYALRAAGQSRKLRCNSHRTSFAMRAPKLRDAATRPLVMPAETSSLPPNTI